MADFWQKIYSKINWRNYPSVETPLNETNLLKMDNALNSVDDRILSLNITKTDVDISNGLIKDVSFDSKTGIFTFTKLNGGTVKIDTLLEKMIINASYDPATQSLVLTMEDGSKQIVPLTDFITQYEFDDSDQLDFRVDNGRVTAVVKAGSIKDSMIQPNYLADLKICEANTKASEQAAAASEANAKASENAAASSETNAKDSEQAAAASEANAKTSEINSKASEVNAKTSEVNAKTSETNAKASEVNAKTSETNAKASEEAAALSETNAKESELNAKDSEIAAKNSENNAYDSKVYADNLVYTASKIMSGVEFKIEDGILYYRTENPNLEFRINDDTGYLEYCYTEA